MPFMLASHILECRLPEQHQRAHIFPPPNTKPERDIKGEARG